MTRGYTADQLRQGRKGAAAALNAHRHNCGDCAQAWHLHRPALYCAHGYQLLTDLHNASRQLARHLEEVQAAANRQPTLFDALEG